MKIGKYEFESLEQANSKIEALGITTDENGNKPPSHKHTIVRLGNIVLVQGEYDEDGNEVVAPTLSDKYSVDVLWQGIESHPYGWATKSINIDSEGVHGFAGVSYQENKM